jgi:hypothetical protein
VVGKPKTLPFRSSIQQTRQIFVVHKETKNRGRPTALHFCKRCLQYYLSSIHIVPSRLLEDFPMASSIL